MSSNPVAGRRAARIIAALQGAPSPLPTNEVARAARLEPREAYAVLSQLLAAGEVQRGGAGRRARPGEKQVRWRLHPDRADPDDQLRADVEASVSPLPAPAAKAA